MSNTEVHMQWGVRIPLRDGVHLHAALYRSRQPRESSPAIFTLTPYMGQTYHDRAVYFASHGYNFLTVDVRGRGNSEGSFKPNINEGPDGYDVVEWVACQPWCNGKVAMWGGSYGGLAQWNTAREAPPHLATIVPVAAPCIGIDFPMRSNRPSPYLAQWLALVAGRASQDRVFGDGAFWKQTFRSWLESGTAFRKLDSYVGMPSAVFQEWMDHPERGEYWDRYNPSAEQYSRMELPVLTITGAYDGDQPGALAHYRSHNEHARNATHCLVIGPWDHAGTRTPKAEVGGMALAPQSVIDLNDLHLQWYEWTMRGGPRPAFLKKPIAYYMTGAETWRYAETLDSVTAHSQPLYLSSSGTACHIFGSGTLGSSIEEAGSDSYRYDPRDLSMAAAEAASTEPLCMRPTFPVDDLTDQSPVFAADGRQLVYHSAPFESGLDVCGFFRLHAWLAIDQPDTDFQACVYELGSDGSSLLLSCDSIRARYRESVRTPSLVRTHEPLLYEFSGFTFVARRLARGSRLRLVIGPVDSIYSQRNYNSGGPVADETAADARIVMVRLFHGRAHRSALYVPLAATEADHV